MKLNICNCNTWIYSLIKLCVEGVRICTYMYCLFFLLFDLTINCHWYLLYCATRIRTYLSSKIPLFRIPRNRLFLCCVCIFKVNKVADYPSLVISAHSSYMYTIHITTVAAWLIVGRNVISTCFCLALFAQHILVLLYKIFMYSLFLSVRWYYMYNK